MSTLQAELIKTYSPTMVDRYHSVCVAIDSVAPLHADWQAMVDGSATAMRVVDDIETHDSNAANALQLATQGRYQDALNQLVRATDMLDDAGQVANTLTNVADVSTLTTWLSRTNAFDDSLRLLWQTMIDSKGKVTAKVTTALRGVNDGKGAAADQQRRAPGRPLRDGREPHLERHLDRDGQRQARDRVDRPDERRRRRTVAGGLGARRPGGRRRRPRSRDDSID